MHNNISFRVINDPQHLNTFQEILLIIFEIEQIVIVNYLFRTYPVGIFKILP